MPICSYTLTRACACAACCRDTVRHKREPTLRSTSMNASMETHVSFLSSKCLTRGILRQYNPCIQLTQVHATNVVCPWSPYQWMGGWVGSSSGFSRIRISTGDATAYCDHLPGRPGAEADADICACTSNTIACIWFAWLVQHWRWDATTTWHTKRGWCSNGAGMLRPRGIPSQT